MSVNIGTNVTSIGNVAFRSCSSLTSIDVPDSVTSIGDGAFYCCTDLESINVDPGNNYYCSIDGNLFDKNKEIFIQYAIGKKDSEYTIPDSVTCIDNRAFVGCTGLTSIIISNSVTSIGDGAFEYCTDLKRVFIPNSVTYIGNWAFDSCNGLSDIYYGGSETGWENIDIDDWRSNAPLLNATIHYNYVMTDPDTYAISNIQAASGGVELNVQSNKSVSGEQIVIIAYYDAEGALLDLETQPITYSETEQTISFNGNENAVSVKAFIWNVLDGMMPASEAAEADIT